ncbi:MAG TPA: hypothetical protein PKC39_14345 [Ferruginibacter sp.]|nr:hypothetical protein [Ferruginibacter sp.]HMP22135.1 hypothetical protein [Ferruginibacter sp.]
MSGNWKKRIEQFEQAPPPGVWESIAQKLDDNKTTLQQRLLQHEAPPPPAAWEHITASLNAQQQSSTPVIALPKKNNKQGLYYAIAASILLILFAGVFYFNQNKLKNSTAAVNHTGTNSAISNTNTDTITQHNHTVAATRAKTSIAATPVYTNTKKATSPVAVTQDDTDSIADEPIQLSYITMSEPLTLAGPPELDKHKKLLNPEGNIITDIALMNVPSTYIMIIGPNGDELRVSTKFSKLVNYINDKLPASEEYLDKVIKEGTYWKGKFKNWRDKMIQNTITPSPSNFMDIIELSKLVKEK